MNGRGTAAVVVVTAIVVCPLAAAVGCARPPAPAPPGPRASALIAAAADLGSTPTEVEEAWRALDAIADRTRDHHRRSRGDWVDDLNAVVFGELGYEREIESRDPRFFRLPSVIAQRRGSCLGLGALYLALGERLGVALDGVMVPGHFFVRRRSSSTDATARNVELLRRGEAMPDDWYRGKYGPWPATTDEYLRPLAVWEVAAVHWFNAGNFLRAGRDLPRAAIAYARAAADFPAFAEAKASLGAVRQLQGSLGDAEAAYEDAARARADLPGLAENVAVLRRERLRETPPAIPLPQTAPAPERRPDP
jgi:regulator of sirC expression with transglutaminase-like and TPR domain